MRVVRYIRGLDWKLDRVAYKAHPDPGYQGRPPVHHSLAHPFGSYGWRAKPLYTIIFFAFHIGLVVTPLFLPGHAVIIEERWGIHWPTISMALADVLTITVIVTTVFIAMRRIGLPEVRIVTTLYDYFLLLITVTPLRLRLSGRASVRGLRLLALHPHSRAVSSCSSPFRSPSSIISWASSSPGASWAPTSASNAPTRPREALPGKMWYTINNNV